MIFSLLFPLVKGILGDGLVEKFLNHKKELAASANEREKINLDAEIKVLEFEVRRRDTIKELQLKEYEHPLLWWPKFLIMLTVAVYWFIKISSKTLGLADFNIEVAELSDTEKAVSAAVLGYMFLGNKIERMFRTRNE